MQWSSPKKLKGAAIFSKVIGENEHGVFVLRYRNRFYSKNVILEKYNHLLVFEEARNFDLKNARLVKIYLTKKGILLVRTEYNRKTQNNDLIAQLVDFNFKNSGKEIVLASQYSTVYGDRGSFRMRVSDNQELYSLIYRTESDSNNYVLHHKLLDENLVIKSENHLELPYDFDHFAVVDFGVSNKGEVSLLTKYGQFERRRLVEISQSMYKINGQDVSDYLISDSFELKDAELMYQRNIDRHSAVALYGPADETGIEGVLFFKVLADSAVSVVHPFDGDFVAKMTINSRKAVVSEGFDILQLIPRDDGGVLFIAEQKEIATENKVIMVNGIPQSTSKNVYNFNEILVMNFDSEGFMDWNHVIKKNQTTINDGGYFSSAVVMVADKFVQIIFNDQMRNSGEIMQHTIYNNGKSTSTKLLKTELDYVAVIPIEAKQVASNKIIIPTSKNRRFALLKLIYP